MRPSSVYNYLHQLGGVGDGNIGDLADYSLVVSLGGEQCVFKRVLLAGSGRECSAEVRGALALEDLEERSDLALSTGVISGLQAAYQSSLFRALLCGGPQEVMSQSNAVFGIG